MAAYNTQRGAKDGCRLNNFTHVSFECLNIKKDIIDSSGSKERELSFISAAPNAR